MSGRDPIDPLTEAARAGLQGTAVDIQIRELVALTDEGRTPMLVDPHQAEAVAVRALSVVDLHEAHLGCRVVVAFERGDPSRPIVMGVLAGQLAWPALERPESLEVLSHGGRVVVAAKSQLVLRCGKASITLTAAGKVLMEGAYILSRSTGVNRLNGGTVQIN